MIIVSSPAEFCLAQHMVAVRADRGQGGLEPRQRAGFKQVQVACSPEEMEMTILTRLHAPLSVSKRSALVGWL